MARTTNPAALAAAAAMAGVSTVALLTPQEKAVGLKAPTPKDFELDESTIVLTVKARFKMADNPERAITQDGANFVLAKDSADAEQLAIRCVALSNLVGLTITSLGKDGHHWFDGNLPALGTPERQDFDAALAQAKATDVVADITIRLTGDAKLKQGMAELAPEMQLYSPSIAVEAVENIEAYNFLKHKGFARGVDRSSNRPQNNGNGGGQRGGYGNPMGEPLSNYARRGGV